MTARAGQETCLFAAWLLAFAATLAVLFIGEVLGQTPCNLCWFQRAFMFPLPVVLGLALWWNDPGGARYGVALALLGGAVALWHLGLYSGLLSQAVLPCSQTGPSCTGENQQVLGLPIPLLALLAFAAIAGLCLMSMKGKTH